MVSNDTLIAESLDLQDRRAKMRFSISQDVLYRAMVGKRVREMGGGKTINISSSGVSFTTDNMLPVGMTVELSINWPVLLRDTCPIKLMIYGQVVRCSDEAVVIATERYEFRTRARTPNPAGCTSGSGPT